MVSPAFYAADQAMRHGNPAGALHHFRIALAEEPDSALVHAALSLCLGALNRRYGAMEEALEALRLDPGLPAAKIAYGYASLLADDDREAERAAREVLQDNPNSNDALWLRCEIALAGRKHGVLREAAFELLAHDPESSGAKTFLSRAESMRGEGLAAEKLAVEALTLRPEDANAHEALGWALLAQGRAKAAREAALMALKLAPDGPALLLLAAATLRARPLTGWLFWPGLQMMRRSDGVTLVFLMSLLVSVTVAENVLHYFERTDFIPVLDTAYWSIIVALVAFNFAVRFMVERDIERVRLRPGF